jgi:hypothetical protein
MLSSLLPGIRQLRAPFVAGVISMVAVYLLLDKQIDTLIQPSAADPGVETIVSLLGLGGRLAVGAIAAYLVGSLILQAIDYIRYFEERFKGWMTKKYNFVDWAAKSEEWTLWSRLAIPFSRSSLVRLVARCEFDPNLIEAVQSDIRRGRGKGRLLVVSKDLYLEYDRLEAEAEFRRAVAWPGLILLVALVASLSWPIWAVWIGMITSLIVLLGLAIHARIIQKDANSIYAHAVADDLVSTASLDALKDEQSAKIGVLDNSPSEAISQLEAELQRS